MRFAGCRGIMLLVAGLAGCASAPPTPSAIEKAELAPAGSLRVAVFTGNPVIGSPGAAGGDPVGPTAILGRELAARAGVPARIIDYNAVGRMVEDARAGAWDVAVVAFDPARRNVLDFAAPHLTVDLTYLVAPGSPLTGVAQSDRAGVRIGAARGAATALTLERSLKQARVVTADTEAAVFEMLRAGQVEAIAQNRFLLLGLAAKLPGSRVLEDRFAVAEMTFVLPKGRPAALAWVNAFVADAIRSGAVERAIAGSGLRGVSVAPPVR
jgi:polar amino acid transport system substrate-binding protein